MADPIRYKPKPTRTEPNAHEELERLLETAHEHGVLRFANDLIAANTAWSRILVDGLNTAGSRNAIQNLAVLVMVLSRIEPAQMYRFAFALKEAAVGLDRAAADADTNPPGLTGAYRMLHDRDLWQAVGPLIEGLEVFARQMRREVDKPIADFSGKPVEDG